MQNRSILKSPRLFLGLISLAVLVIGFTPAPAIAEEIGDTIVISKPDFDWAIEIPNATGGYERWNYESITGILGLVNRTLYVGEFTLDNQFFLDEFVEASVFALKSRDPSTTKACASEYFITGEESFYGSWKDKGESTDFGWSIIDRKIDIDEQKLEYQKAGIKAYDGFCFVVLVEVEKGADKDDYETVDTIINNAVLHERYERTVNDYVVYGEIWDPTWYIEAYNLAIRENNMDDEFFDGLLYRATQDLIRRGDYYFAQDILRHIQRYDRDGYLPLYGLGLTYHYLGEYETSERFLKRAFSKQFGLRSYNEASDELKYVYERFEYLLLNEYRQEYIGIRDVLWSDWISDYDFSVEAIQDLIPYLSLQDDEPVISPNGTVIKTGRYSNDIVFKGKYALAHQKNTEDDEGWYLINENSEKVTDEYAKIEYFDNEIMLAGRRALEPSNYINIETGLLFYLDPFITGATLFNGKGVAAAKDLDDMWFHIDKEGNALYPERYHFVGELANGTAIARDDDDRFFHINSDGKRLYPHSFEYAYNFVDNAAVVKDDNGKWFHINKKGEPLYPERYDYVNEFSLGIAKVEDQNKEFYINRNGEPIYEAERMGNMSHGIIAVMNENGAMFHIDRAGKPLYPEKYLYVDDFDSEGASVVDFQGDLYRIDRKGYRTHTIDEETEEYFEIRKEDEQPLYDVYKWVGQLKDDAYAVEDKEGNWFHVSSDGNRLYSENYNWVGDFSNGLVKVNNQEGKWAYITKQGNPIGGQFYEWVSNFINGYAQVEKSEDEWFHINQEGNRIYKNIFISIAAFTEGGAVVVDKKRNTYHICEDGNRCYEKNYQSVGPYQDGKAIVRDFDGNWLYIDLNGNEIKNESPLETLDLYWLQAIGPGGMPCPEVLFGFINPNDPLCGVMQQDLENSIVR